MHKSSDRSQVTNYRPISLLCVISKVLGRIVYAHLKFILMNTILADSQFCFRHQHSTTQQLLVFLNKVHYCLNSNASCDVTYLDFHKAFDSVSHNELLIKLWNIGITGNLWLWIKEYLSDRHQWLCIDGCYSSSLPVISGVPQGSILGPLLYLVCTCQWPAPTNITLRHISLWRWYQMSKICLVGLRFFTQSPIQLEYKLETLL